MPVKKKPTVTVGISAYQSEKNIEKLITTLLLQKESEIEIEKIIVYCDGCKDNTGKIVKKIQVKSPNRIQLLDVKKNKGYAYSVQKIIEKNKSQFLVLLNDDILIRSTTFVENLAKTMIKNTKIGYACGNIVPLQPTNFIGRCVYVSFLTYQPLRLQYKKGISPFTVDGKVMILRKEFADSLNLSSTKETGNVDIFIYFATLSSGWKYAFVTNAKVYYRLPETISDFRNQEMRTRKSKVILEKYFGDIVREEWSIPKDLYLLSSISSFIKYPIESLFFKFVVSNFYLFRNDHFFKTWQLAESTKNL